MLSAGEIVPETILKKERVYCRRLNLAIDMAKCGYNLTLFFSHAAGVLHNYELLVNSEVICLLDTNGNIRLK
jgi:hypothetical protein